MEKRELLEIGKKAKVSTIGELKKKGSCRWSNFTSIFLKKIIKQ